MKVKFLTTDGKTRMNPNLYQSGKVCLSILGTWSGPSWTSCQTIISVFLSILCEIFVKEPFRNEPGMQSSSSKIVERYNMYLNHENLRLAVIHNISNPINDYSIAKDCLRRHLETKCKKFDTNLIWLRLFYVYGVGSRKSSLTSQIENAVLLKKSKFRMTKGLQIRDFIHVGETVKLISKISLDGATSINSPEYIMPMRSENSTIKDKS